MTQDDSDTRGVDALQRALALYVEHADATPEQVAALLEAHGDLRPILAPMFDEDSEASTNSAEERIGDYRILRELGRGGMGVVYEAREERLDRRVALKVLPEARTEDADSLVRFHREAAAAARLDHPGIVKIFAHGNVDGAEYIAMEFLPGPSLADAKGTPELSEVGGIVRCIADVADALHHAHEAGILHRDVKPANILLRGVQPVLTDFGIARRHDQPSVTAAGRSPGTPYYMAPEQLHGASAAVDRRADVFSLGVTLYELLTTQRPFRGESTPEVMQQILSAEPTPLQKLRPGMPADLCAVVNKALEKNPAQRYASAADLAADLRAFLAYRPVSVRPPGPVLRLRRWAQREPLQAILAGLVLLAVPGLTAGLGYWWAIQPTLELGARTEAENRRDRLLAEAFLAMETEETERARQAFEVVRAEDPDNAEAIAGLVLLAGRERWTKALQTLDRLDPPGTAPRPLQRLRALLLGSIGDPDAAVALRQKLGPVEGHLEAFVAGLVEMQRGHRGVPGAFEAALRHLDTCVLTAPRPRPVYHFERAHALGHLLRAEPALAAADALQRLWPDMPEARFWAAFAVSESAPKRAIAELRAALQDEDAQPLWWNNLGDYLRADGQLDAAHAAYDKALDLGHEPVETLYKLALVREKQGQLDAAVAGYRRVIEKNPRDFEAWSAIARLHLDRRRWDQAGEAIDKAMRIAPHDARVRRLLGELQLSRGERDRAVVNLRRSLTIAPSSGAAFHLGRALSSQGKAREAMDAYRQALELDPENAEACNNLANLHKRQREPRAAEAGFRRALEIDPKLENAYANLWGLLNDEARREELFAHCERWRSELPDSAKAWSKSAFTTLWLGPGSRAENARQARPLAEKAIVLAQGRLPVAMHDAAWVLHYAGATPEALTVLRQALQRAQQLGPRYRGATGAITKAIRQLSSQAP